MAGPELIAALRQRSVLRFLPNEPWRAFEATLVVREVGASDVLCKQGELADRLLMAAGRSLSQSFATPDGRLFRVGVLEPYTFVELSAALSGGNWQYTTRPLAKTPIVEGPAAALLAACAGTPIAQFLANVAGSAHLARFADGLRGAAGDWQAVFALIGALEHRTVEVGEVLTESAVVMVDSAVGHAQQERGTALPTYSQLKEGVFYDLRVAGAAPQLHFTQTGIVYTLSDERMQVFGDKSIALVRARLQPLISEPEVEATVVARVPWAEATVLAPTPVGVRRDDGTRAEHLVGSMGATVGAARILDTAGLLDAAAPLAADWTAQTATAHVNAAGEVQDLRGVTRISSIAGTIEALQDQKMVGRRCETEPQSGAACLASVLAYFDRPGAYVALNKRLGDHARPSLATLAQVAEDSGLVAHAFAVESVRSLERLELPLITVLDRRYVVVHTVARGVLTVFDPLHGLRNVPTADFEQHWPRKVLQLRMEPLAQAPAPEPDGADKRQPQATSAAQKRRSGYLHLTRGLWGLMGGAGLAAAMLFVLGLVPPKLNQIVIDNVLVHGDRRLLDVIALGLLLLQVTVLVFQVARDFLLAHVGRVFDHRLMTLFYRKVLKLGVAEHGKERVGRVLLRFEEAKRIRDTLSGEGLTLVLNLLQGAFFTVAVFTYSWKLGLIPLLVAGLSYAVARVGGGRFRRLYLQLFDKQALNQSLSSEQIEGVGTIKSMGATRFATHTWERSVADQLTLRKRLLNTGVGMELGLGSLSQAARIAGTYIAVQLAFAGELTPGAVLAVSQYMWLAVQPLLSLAVMLDQLNQVRISFSKVDEILLAPSEERADWKHGLEATFEGQVTFQDVAFGYDKTGRDVLRGLSFTIEPGTVTAIVGRSGSGKTTLAKLMQGLLQPTNGRILFDKHDAASLAISTVRRNVGMVLQDNHLFAGTIAQNIAYRDDKPNHEAIVRAARLAAADEFVAALPAGYNTFLAEGGMGLSGGQKQRICLARALYHDPRILILDEATSALDTESERAILANMEEILSGRTAIVIAHRLNTVRNADRILVVERGEIIESGTHQELLEHGGLYHSLFSRQQVA